MTPGARLAAAAEILDCILDGQRAEPALMAWARGSRYAGSKDRAAVRDLVFDALRRRRSYGVLGGRLSGRGLMIGALRAAGEDPATLVTGEGYGMAALDAEDAAGDLAAEDRAVNLDMPDWVCARMDADWAAQAENIMEALRHRAPVFLRVNMAKGGAEAAQAALRQDGIETVPHVEVKTALQVTENERRVRNNTAYKDGLVELQDASSQAAVLALDLKDGQRVLDYCAGGGGKALAMAGCAQVEVVAHDALAQRMADLPERAARAGVKITVMDGAELAESPPFDLVLVDAPCSGSGTWRRDPDTKWRLTTKELHERCKLQAKILNKAAELVGAEGRLAYATCSVLRSENDDQATAFLSNHPEWRELIRQQWLPSEDGDGFFLVQFQKLGSQSG